MKSFLKRTFGPSDDGAIIVGFVVLTLGLQAFVSIKTIIETRGLF